jgi:hypothetical protein
MKAPVTWESVIDDKNYTFTYTKKNGKNFLTVNDEPINIKLGLMSSLSGFDEKIMLDGKAVRVVISNNKPDVVVDGVFLGSGKKYSESPLWALVFAIACMFIPITSLGGLVPFAMGFGGVLLCIAASRLNLPVVMRLIVCMFITAVAWGLWYLHFVVLVEFV